MKAVKILIPVLAVVCLAACDSSGGPYSTQNNVVGGAAIGAIGGAAIGAISGSAGTGALIGAGVGAVGGYLYDRNTNYYYDSGYYY